MCGDFFFFKQKTAYEMRISDWSSDVCSSDLGRCGGLVLRAARICKVGRTAQPPIHPDGGNRKTVRGNRRAGNRIIAMTDEPHNAAETEPAGKLPTIVAVHATGTKSLRFTRATGNEGAQVGRETGSGGVGQSVLSSDASVSGTKTKK